MTPEQEKELWRYVLACVQQSAKYAKMAAEAAEEIKAGRKPTLSLVEKEEVIE